MAKSIQKNLNDSIHKENKRVAMKLDSVYIMKHVEIPTTIVECGFLSNPEEEQQLLTDEYQDKLAWQRSCLINIANSGFFSSDRTIEQYATEIWKLPKVNK